jgi:AcrR family transcriptional regulator
MEKRQRPRGRPFDRSRGAAILSATLALLSEVGYDRLTMEMVAVRAKAGKGALYRRWSSKSDLVVAAITSLNEQVECPNTGSLWSDLEQFLAMTEGSNDYAFEANLIGGMAAAACHDPDLAQASRDMFIRPRQEVLMQILSHAVERSEIPAARDLEILAQVVPGLLLLRAVTRGQPPGVDFARQVFMEVLYPLAVSPIPPS